MKVSASSEPCSQPDQALNRGVQWESHSVRILPQATPCTACTDRRVVTRVKDSTPGLIRHQQPAHDSSRQPSPPALCPVKGGQSTLEAIGCL
ncbi:unnamed protein product [Arctogadus glacialis]